jgi:crotonobetainyl-CoA:carnitine CoA-transferase CaiB-like acyl-CoA transferase
MTDAVEGPLQGIRVLDFTTMMSGPMATRLLADMGCDVVKVEAPPAGDHNRRRTPTFGDSSRYFAQMNNGKRSVLLDLKSPGDLALALDLAAQSDVLIENNRPGVMARLGVGYDDVRARNPRIVYAAISGYGQSGLASQRPAYAPNITADSGFDMANMLYQADPATPANTAIFIPDAMAALHTTIAVQAALLGRERTGAGQFIDISLFDTMFNLMVYELQIAQLGTPPDRSVYSPVATLEGYVSIAPVTQQMFEKLAVTIGRSEIIDDPRWATQTARELNWGAMMDMVREWAKGMKREDVLAELNAAGVAAAPYRTPTEALNDPHVRARGLLVPQHDDGGDFFLFNPPFAFADGSVHARGDRPSPSLNADRADVLKDWLGESARLGWLRA